MGIVYEATQLSLDRKVALKLIASDLSDDFEYRNRFEREGRIQAAIDHPHIVTVYEAGESKYGLFIAMRLIRGSTLKDLILGRELDAGRSLRILGQVAGALDTAHEAGLIHRDVKPQNILVSRARDHGYLADFGVMKGRGTTNLTRAGQIVGTIDYMAPEQIRGEPATQASDIYGLAAVLYESFSGTVPYPKQSDVAVIYAHLHEPPPRLTPVRPELPVALDEVLERAMAKDPAARYPSAVAMVDAADEALGDAARLAIRVPAPVENPEEIGIRRPERAVTTAAARDQAAAEPVRPTQAAAAPPTAAAVPPTAAAAPPTAAPAPPTAASPATVHVPVAAAEVPVAARPRRRTGLPLALAAAAAILLLAGVGFVLGHRGSKTETPATTPASSVSRGAISIVAPQGWSERSVPRIPGMKLTYSGALGPASKSAGTLVAGRAQGVWPHYLPASFVRRLESQSAVNRREVVKIGHADAFRYRGLRVKGLSQSANVYVVPQRAGSQTLICLTVGPSFAATCESTVAGARVDGTGVSLTPSPAYASAVTTAVKRSSSARASGLGSMGRAKTPLEQASAARAVAGAYDAAARKLMRATSSPLIVPANTKIVGAFSAAASAYRKLAIAAGSSSPKGYAAARRQAAQAEAGLQASISGLGQIGFGAR